MSQMKTKFIKDNAVNEDKVRLSNNAALRARNAANDADVSIVKVNASDIVEFVSHPQISSSAVNANDVLTKKDQDAALEGLKPKEAVRVATTANITLSGVQTIDGVLLVAGERVLVKDQTNSEDNGIYVVDAGAWPRSADFNELTPIDEIHGATVSVQEGTTQKGFVFVQYGTVATLDTDPITFTYRTNLELNGAEGITVTGNSIALDHDGEGLAFSGAGDAAQLALELDGATLTKSASGLKVADGQIDEIHLSSNVDAESFVMSASYDSSAASGNVAVSDSIEDAVEKVEKKADDNAAAIAALTEPTPELQNFTLNGTDIANQYVDLNFIAQAGSVTFIPEGGPIQREGVDFVLSIIGGSYTRVTFAGDLATGGAAALVNTDEIQIKYTHLA